MVMMMLEDPSRAVAPPPHLIQATFRTLPDAQDSAGPIIPSLDRYPPGQYLIDWKRHKSCFIPAIHRYLPKNLGTRREGNKARHSAQLDPTNLPRLSLASTRAPPLPPHLPGYTYKVPRCPSLMVLPLNLFSTSPTFSQLFASANSNHTTIPSSPSSQLLLTSTLVQASKHSSIKQHVLHRRKL